MDIPQDDASQKTRILLVDDDMRLRMLMASYLKGYKTDNAKSAAEAWEKLDSFEPDIVILDVGMPGMNGFELCRNIRRNPQFQFVKVLFLSSFVRLEDRLLGYEAGGDDYLGKPFDKYELLAKLNVLSRLKRIEELGQIKQSFLRQIAESNKEPIAEIRSQCQQILESENGPTKNFAIYEKILEAAQELGNVTELAMRQALHSARRDKFGSLSPDLPMLLLVESDIFWRDRLTSVLSEFSVVAVDNAADALAILANAFPEILIISLPLEGVDAGDFCQKTKAKIGCEFLKILALQKDCDVKDRLDLYRSGVDSFLSKPVNSEELYAKCRVLSRLRAAEEIDKAQADFLMLAAHETRSPLEVIRGSCEFLLDEREAATPIADALVQKILSSNARLARLCEQATLATKLNSPPQLDITSISLPAVIDEAIDAAARIRRIDRKLVTQQVPEVILMVDHGLIVRALAYLLENALVHGDPEAPVHISAAQTSNTCSIYVRDQGCGIPPQVLRYMFQPFTVGSVEHHERGTGLSLMLARAIAHWHEGSLTISTAKGQGTTVTLELPLKSAGALSLI